MPYQHHVPRPLGGVRQVAVAHDFLGLGHRPGHLLQVLEDGQQHPVRVGLAGGRRVVARRLQPRPGPAGGRAVLEDARGVEGELAAGLWLYYRLSYLPCLGYYYLGRFI